MWKGKQGGRSEYNNNSNNNNSNIKRPKVKRNQDYLPRKQHLLKFLYTEWQEKQIFCERQMGLSYKDFEIFAQ
jgi:hypothetical protein